MKELRVKYHNGTCAFLYHNASGAQVRQVLVAIHDDMVKLGGQYTWTIDGGPGNYQIIATCKEGSWIDGRGKSPSLALKDCYVARTVLMEYGIE
jgi:hypothetical protein